MAFGGSLQNTSMLQVGPDRVTDRHDAFRNLEYLLKSRNIDGRDFWEGRCDC